MGGQGLNPLSLGGSENVGAEESESVTTDDLTVTTDGSITFNSDLTVDADFQINTAGGGSDSITIRDAANSNDLLVLNEGGVVGISDGILTINGGAVQNVTKINGVNAELNFEASGVQLDLDSSVAFAIRDENDDSHFTVNEDDNEIVFSPGASEAFTLTGSDETADGMNLDPETDQEDAFLQVDIGSNSYEIPLYDAA